MSRDHGNGNTALPKKTAASSDKDEGEPSSKRDSKKSREDSEVDSETDRKNRSSRKKAREDSEVDSETDRKHRSSRKKAREDSEVDSETDRKHRSSRKKARESSDSDGDKRRWRKRKSRRRYSTDSDSDSGSGSDSEEDESERSGSDSESLNTEESEGERKERKRKERRRRREKEEERKRRRREKRRKKEKEEERRKKEKRKKKKKEKKEKGKKGAVTDSWGKYGVIRETDMWTKRPEFTAWLAEVKEVNMETLSNWEEKQMFKQFMEDHNTATFPSKKYYSLDAYYRHQMEKEMKKGIKKIQAKERTVFNDEEQRRLELLQAREKHKEEQVIALKRSMESGMAQAMKEQAQLREEMAYQYKLGNFEAAAAIQRRLDPDAAV